MERKMSKVIGFVLLMAVAGSVLAGGPPPHFGPPPPSWPWPFRAPEIDPASAFAGLTMLAGTLAVIRGRRAKNKADKSE
jgi:hypothetical protein